MDINIKRFDKELPLPIHHTDGAAAFDLAAREEVTVPAGGIGYVPVNIAVATPPGHFLMIAARSSTHKKGIMLGNGVGIIDPDYSGNEDEIKVVCYNFTAEPVIIEKGFRIAQGVFVPTAQFAWNETDDMQNKTRGGFGTTGNA